MGRLWNLKNLLLLDVAVCVSFIGTLLFNHASFEEMSGLSAPTGLRLLFVGIYSSWAMVLAFLAYCPQLHSSPALPALLSVSAALQIVIGRFVPSSAFFFYVNQAALIFWVVAFASFAVRSLYSQRRPR